MSTVYVKHKPCATVGTDYALSALSALFPETLTSRVAFLFTNVTSPLHFNFSKDTVPDVLKDAHTPDDADNDPTIKYAQNSSSICILTVFPSDVESLRKGVIKTSKNKAYTILLVGETGVGKSSVLELLANILLGKDTDHYDFEILDHTNEQGGLDNQSRTNSARLYEYTSSNGVVVSTRVFDYSEYA